MITGYIINLNKHIIIIIINYFNYKNNIGKITYYNYYINIIKNMTWKYKIEYYSTLFKNNINISTTCACPDLSVIETYLNIIVILLIVCIIIECNIIRLTIYNILLLVITLNISEYQYHLNIQKWAYLLIYY
uniref:Uncharacterized protein n=1 Tax=Gefionella okellyi TaxID=2853422 RepID=A0A0B5H4S9_9EUKA|nr:hypothetical protein [Gefionella okellyi]